MDFSPLPGDVVDDVLFSVQARVGMIQLNNPKKLNSLTASMIRKMNPKLKVSYLSTPHELLAHARIVGMGDVPRY